MIDNLIDFDSLRAIGMTPQILQQLRELPPLAGEPHVMRVTELQRDGMTLHDGQRELDARALPALLRSLDDAGDALAVGDWVLAEQFAHGEWWVHTRMPPLTQIARRLHDGRDKVSRAVIVSNVDVALLVMGLDMDFNLRRLERYLALASGADVDAVVVLTKADLCSDTDARLRSVHRVLPARCGVVAVNALSDDCRAALADWLQPGRTLVLVGSSGAGKSTLTNTLTPGPAMPEHRPPALRDAATVAAATPPPPARCTEPSMAPASSTRRGCARCVWTAASTRSTRFSPTSPCSRRCAAFATAITSTNRVVRCATRSAPNGSTTTTSCCARRGATRSVRCNASSSCRSGRRAAARGACAWPPSAADRRDRHDTVTMRAQTCTRPFLQGLLRFTPHAVRCGRSGLKIPLFEVS